MVPKMCSTVGHEHHEQIHIPMSLDHPFYSPSVRLNPSVEPTFNESVPEVLNQECNQMPIYCTPLKGF